MTKLKASMLLSILLLSSGCVKREQAVSINVPDNRDYNTPQEIVVIPNNTITQPVIVDNSPFDTIDTSIPQVIPSTYTIPRSRYLGGAYRNNAQLKRFINMMVSKYNYDRYTLNTIFSTVSRDKKALEKYNVFKTAKPTFNKATKIGSWMLKSLELDEDLKYTLERKPLLSQ